MPVLVVTAVEAERDAVLRGLTRTGEQADHHPLGRYDALRVDSAAGRVDVLAGGVGSAAAAAATATALTLDPAYDVVLSAGIAGGFAGRAQIGDVVLAEASVAADLGCRTVEGFRTLRQIGLHQDVSVAFADSRLDARLRAAGLPVVTGAVLSLTCMTGTDERAAELAAAHPAAVAEAMEGYGVVTAAADHPALSTYAEIRGVSNLVGRRDPAAWDVDTAFDVLGRAVAAVLAEPLP